MKKAITIIVAVAILGLLGLFVNGQKSESPPSVSNDNAHTAATNTSSNISSDTNSNSTLGYKDGSYTESSETPYGAVKITVVITGGKISDVLFDDMPNGEDRSAEITAFSSAKLRQSAIDAQSANVDFVSGATSTSYGFQESLQAALDAAKMS